MKREVWEGEGKKGKEKEGRGREWTVKMYCPMSNKLSPPMALSISTALVTKLLVIKQLLHPALMSTVSAP